MTTLTRLGLLAGAFVGALVLAISVSIQPTASAAPLPAPPVTREAALARARASSAVLRVDRLESKLTTWAELQAARGTNDQFVSHYDSQPLWLVVAAGDFVPDFADGRHFTWAVIVIDANTGEHVSTYGGGAAWPDFFTRMTDRAP